MPGKFKEIVIMTISFLVYKNILKQYLRIARIKFYTIKVF
ncbi:hypothetical protein CLH_3168 [Clostridium botulinum E3 str. Alaska E43]|nr:hypothetical protein CLH_3168 [Clostridium botulinum E3 str. Alaska E43]